MKTGVDPAFLASLQNESARVVALVDFGFATPYRVTNLDIDYWYGGQQYLAREVSIGVIVSTSGLSVDRVEIKVANPSRELSAILLGADQRGKLVTIRVAAIDDDGQLIGSGEAFAGLLSNYEIFDDRADLKCVNFLVMWKKKAMRKAQSSCPWPFRGSECGFAGSEDWCNQTYDRCAALGNTDNFGGNRFLDYLAEARIWWGRVQE